MKRKQVPDASEILKKSSKEIVFEMVEPFSNFSAEGFFEAINKKDIYKKLKKLKKDVIIGSFYNIDFDELDKRLDKMLKEDE